MKAAVTVAGTSDQTVQASVEGFDTASLGQDSPPQVCDRSSRMLLNSMVTMGIVAEVRGELYKSVEASRRMEELRGNDGRTEGRLQQAWCQAAG